MWTALLGAGISAIGGLIGSHNASKQAEAAQALVADSERRYSEAAKQRDALMAQNMADIREDEAENRSLYERRIGQDYTQTAEAVNLMRKAREAAREGVERAEGQQAVMGGTDESVAAAKHAAGKMLSDTFEGVAARGDAQRRLAETDYMQGKRYASNNRTSALNAQAAAAMSDAQAYGGFNQQRINAANAGAQASAQAGGALMQLGTGMINGAIGNAFNKNPFKA